MKQGLVLRTGGLNCNAKSIYYTYEEILELFRQGRLKDAGVDKRHYAWLTSLVERVRELPGETIAQKINGYYLSLGFTQEQLDELRERLLEPKK